MAIGLVARTVKDAVDQVRAQGIKAGLLRPITVWPFPDRRIAELCQGKQRILTCEMNEGQLYHMVRELSGTTPVEKITQSTGQIITADKVIAAIKGE